jgi:carboxymethylenebutenolidase
MSDSSIPDDLYALYDEYCHTGMKRREFLRRAAAIPVIGGLSGVACAQRMLPDYQACPEVAFTDERVKASYERYESPGGNGDAMRGYLARPAADTRAPAVLVVHENRGLNPYIEDVARRLAIEGFVAFAPDALAPSGGYPGNDDDGKVLQAALDRDKIVVDMANGARFLKAHPQSSGRLGVTGFCFGGYDSNQLAVVLGDELSAAAPFYGSAPSDEEVTRIRARMLVHYAEDDPRVNAGREAYRAALEDNGARFEIHTYPGTKHGFHNYSTARYDADAAALAWSRTLALFREALA